MYDYIFIDLDGTILDCRKRHYECYKTIISELNGKCISIDKYWKLKRQKADINDILFVSQCHENKIIYIKRWKELIETKDMLNYDVLTDENRNALINMRNLTKKLYLITKRNNCINLQKQLENLNINNVFTEIIIVAGSKKNVVKNMNIENLRTVFIGDTEEDEEAAREINALFIAVTSGIRKKDLLNANIYIEKLSDMGKIEL